MFESERKWYRETRMIRSVNHPCPFQSMKENLNRKKTIGGWLGFVFVYLGMLLVLLKGSYVQGNLYASVNSSDISYNQFPSSTPSCPQNLGHDLSIISEEIEALDKIINQSLQCITRDSTKECVSTETQTGGISSTEYVYSGVGTNDDLFVMVANKARETDSDCHQLIATLRETISLLKYELRNKQVTIDNLIDAIKNFTVIGKKYTKNKEQEVDAGSKEKNEVVGELLEID